MIIAPPTRGRSRRSRRIVPVADAALSCWLRPRRRRPRLGAAARLPAGRLRDHRRHVVAAPGRTIEGGTVVVRDGVIEAVGPDGEVEVPYDAETIDGKGLFVYPGFLDLYTTIGQDDAVPRSATGLGRPIPLRSSPRPAPRRTTATA